MRNRFTMGETGGSRRGVTLVELLVVVAILAMLLATMVPLLSTVREQARRTACQANLRSVAQGWRLYVQDAGCFPFDDSETGAPPVDLFFGGKNSGAIRPAGMKRIDRFVNPYVGADQDDPTTTGVFACPSDRGLQGSGPWITKDTTTYDTIGNSYAANQELFSRGPGEGISHGLRLNDVRAPESSVVLVGDFMMRGKGRPDWPHHGYWHDKLDQEVNIGFLDGHAALVRLEPGRESTAAYRYSVRWAR